MRYIAKYVYSESAHSIKNTITIATDEILVDAEDFDSIEAHHISTETHFRELSNIPNSLSFIGVIIDTIDSKEELYKWEGGIPS